MEKDFVFSRFVSATGTGLWRLRCVGAAFWPTPLMVIHLDTYVDGNWRTMRCGGRCDQCGERFQSAASRLSLEYWKMRAIRAEAQTDMYKDELRMVRAEADALRERAAAAERELIICCGDESDRSRSRSASRATSRQPSRDPSQRPGRPPARGVHQGGAGGAGGALQRT